jgi:hypothetical protein
MHAVTRGAQRSRMAPQAVAREAEQRFGLAESAEGASGRYPEVVWISREIKRCAQAGGRLERSAEWNRVLAPPQALIGSAAADARAAAGANRIGGC